jgi:hypothetical protein
MPVSTANTNDQMHRIKLSKMPKGFDIKFKNYLILHCTQNCIYGARSSEHEEAVECHVDSVVCLSISFFISLVLLYILKRVRRADRRLLGPGDVEHLPLSTSPSDGAPDEGESFIGS